MNTEQIMERACELYRIANGRNDFSFCVRQAKLEAQYRAAAGGA